MQIKSIIFYTIVVFMVNLTFSFINFDLFLRLFESLYEKYTYMRFL